MKKITFGEYLGQIIRLNNLSQKDAAKLLHLSPQTLSNYILDKRTPDLPTMIYIMRELHMDANRVFEIIQLDDASALRDDEIELIKYYRRLKTNYQSMVLDMMKGICKNEDTCKLD